MSIFDLVVCPNRDLPPTIQNSLMRDGNFLAADQTLQNAGGSLCVKPALLQFILALGDNQFFKKMNNFFE